MKSVFSQRERGGESARNTLQCHFRDSGENRRSEPLSLLIESIARDESGWYRDLFVPEDAFFM